MSFEEVWADVGQMQKATELCPNERALERLTPCFGLGASMACPPAAPSSCDVRMASNDDL